MTDATGFTLEEGETLVFRPLGNGRFRLVGRIAPAEWKTIRSPSAGMRYASRSTRCPRGPGRTTWRRRVTEQSGTRRRLRGSSGGWTRRRASDRGRARRRLGATRRHRRAGRRGVGDRRRPQRDRARRSRHARGQALPAAVLKRIREPEHGDVRPARTALVHRPERNLRAARSRSGALRVFRSPGGSGPYGIATTPTGQVWYASLAGSHIARINLDTGKATIVSAADARAKARGGSGRTRAGGSG